MPRHILDPTIALPIPAASIEFWERFMAWSRDSRVTLGAATYDELADRYSTRICTDGNYIPAGLSKGVHRAVNSLLARPPAAGDKAEIDVLLKPPFLGLEEHARFLSADIGRLPDPVLVVGSVSENWDSGITQTQNVASAVPRVLLHFSPSMPTPEELATLRSKALSATRVLVVGSQPDVRLIAVLEDRLGLGGNLAWVPCERHKPPRNLDAQIRGLAGSPAVVICITGRVGHATSGKVKTATNTHSVFLIEVETAPEVVSSLEALADRLLAG
jgi:hypothetical protein